MDLYERRIWFAGRDDPTQRKGSVRRETVTNLEIWSECFGNNPSDMKAADTYMIASILVKISGWEKTNRRQRIPIYGQQRLYNRVSVTDGTDLPAISGVPDASASPDATELFPFLE